MDIRKKVGDKEDKQELTFSDEKQVQSFDQQLTDEERQNLTNVAIYNLAKKKAVYSQMSTQYTQQIKYGSKQRFMNFFVVYSYKPFFYLGFAFLFQVLKKRLTAIDVFVHASIWLLINQYEFNQGLKTSHANQMQEYEEASANYERALFLQKFSLWEHLKQKIEYTITPNDLLKAMQARVF